MAQPTTKSILLNPLASVAQLEASSSRLDGVPQDSENSVHFAASKLIQAAGPLLRLPQDVVASAIVTYTRFWIGPDGGSLRELGAQVSNHRTVRVSRSDTDRLGYRSSQSLPSREAIRLSYLPP